MVTNVNPQNQQPGAPDGAARHAPWPFSSQRLAEQLVALGFLPAATVSDMIAHATRNGQSLVDAALERGGMLPEALRDAMSQIFELPAVDLSSGEVDESAFAGFPPQLAQAHLIVPLERTADRLVVAVADPTRSRILKDVRRVVGLPLELRLATARDLAVIVQRLFAPRLSAKFPNGTRVDFVVPAGGAKIGRAEHNDIVLADPSVSSTHAVLRPFGTGFQLLDFGSRNGVFVNRRRLQAPRALVDKDKIVIGKVTLKYKVPEAIAASAPAEEPGEKSWLSWVSRNKDPRLRAAWIAFWSRIIAQSLGAAALIILGLAIGGGLPTSCSPFGSQNAAGSARSHEPPAATSGPSADRYRAR